MPTDSNLCFNDDGFVWNEGLVHQVVVCQYSNSRKGLAKQKTRSEVSGGGRKPWKQKGTGRARAGSIRSPIWRGGGATFAVKEKNYSKKINKKVYSLAIKMILLKLQSLDALSFVEDLSIVDVSTKKASSFLVDIGINVGVSKTLIVVDSVDESTYLSFRNIKNVLLVDVSCLGVLQLVNCNNVVMMSSAKKTLDKKYNFKTEV